MCGDWNCLIGSLQTSGARITRVPSNTSAQYLRTTEITRLPRKLFTQAILLHSTSVLTFSRCQQHQCTNQHSAGRRHRRLRAIHMQRSDWTHQLATPGFSMPNSVCAGSSARHRFPRRFSRKSLVVPFHFDLSRLPCWCVDEVPLQEGPRMSQA
jgi:hypothetical protein